uniref:Uncharacterized protein n=1 Tax=Panagrolaimus superbus TaxID=310955 RepID=A0A914YBP5_9BILA
MSMSSRPSNQPLTRHDGNVDVELCHIVAFATKADLTVKKVDDKKVDVHFEKPGCFCGAMTLTMSIKLICILELAIVSILILQAPDLLHRTTNNHFYVTDGSFVFFSVPLFLLEMFRLPGILEVWWLFTVIDFYRQVLINERINHRLRRESQEALRNIFANGLLNFHKNKFRKGSSIA